MDNETDKATREELTPNVEATDSPVKPLTYNERREMNALSLEAFGRSSLWQKRLNNGELKAEHVKSANGKDLVVKRQHYFTVQQIKTEMEKILSDRIKKQLEAMEKKKEVVDENPKV